MNNEIKTYIMQNYKDIFKDSFNSSISITHEGIVTKLSKRIDINEESAKSLTFLDDWFNLIFNQDYITNLLSKNFNEIVFHGHDAYEIDNEGNKKKFETTGLNQEDYELSLIVLSQKLGVTFNFTEPFASFDYENKRFTLIHKSISAHGESKVFIRKHRDEIIPLNMFTTNLAEESRIIEKLQARKNIIIAGSTGSGKTTLLKSCLQYISKDDHIITIEDTHELKCESLKMTHLIANGRKNKTMQDYCHYSLRMSPDRIILGEIRSSEIVPLMLAVNSGHEGMLSTIHANSAVDTISRLSMLFTLYGQGGGSISYDQVMKLICTNIDCVIYVKNKRISEIIEVRGAENGVPIYTNLNSHKFIGNLQRESYVALGRAS